MQKYNNWHWKTLIFLLICILIYAGVCWWCLHSWPSIMAGGEPIPQDVLENPSWPKVLAAQAQFVRSWRIDCYMSLCAFGLLLACIFYGLYVFISLNLRTLYARQKRHIRCAILSLDLTIPLLIWHRMFRVSANVRILLARIIDILIFVLCIAYFISSIWMLICIFIDKIHKKEDVLCRIFCFVGYVLSFLGTFLHIDWLDAINWRLHHFSNFLSSFVYPQHAMLYTLKAPIHYFIAMIPVFVPWLYLCICCCLCHPRSVGTAPLSGKLTTFMSIEKLCWLPHAHIERTINSDE